jgi:hypothetical protein
VPGVYKITCYKCKMETLYRVEKEKEEPKPAPIKTEPVFVPPPIPQKKEQSNESPEDLADTATEFLEKTILQEFDSALEESDPKIKAKKLDKFAVEKKEPEPKNQAAAKEEPPVLKDEPLDKPFLEIKYNSKIRFLSRF